MAKSEFYIGPLSDDLLQRIITLLKEDNISHTTHDFKDIEPRMEQLHFMAKYKAEKLKGHLFCLSIPDDQKEPTKKCLYGFFGFEDASGGEEELAEETNEERQAWEQARKKKANSQKRAMYVVTIILAILFVFSMAKRLL